MKDGERRCQVYREGWNGWKEYPFMKMQSGDIFRLLEPDGTTVKDKKGFEVWRTLGRPYLDTNGVPTVAGRHLFIAPRVIRQTRIVRQDQNFTQQEERKPQIPVEVFNRAYRMGQLGADDDRWDIQHYCQKLVALHKNPVHYLEDFLLFWGERGCYEKKSIC